MCRGEASLAPTWQIILFVGIGQNEPVSEYCATITTLLAGEQHVELNYIINQIHVVRKLKGRRLNVLKERWVCFLL